MLFFGLLSRMIIMIFGILYPSYASYKAIRTKNVKEYVRWMMYWIVYGFFTCIETFTDIFLSWFPFYYEVKVIIVIWLLAPATKGSSMLYRKFVHPMLNRREQEIDEYINQAKERSYSAVLQLGSKGMNYATNVIMQTALKQLTQVSGFNANNEQTLQIMSKSQSDGAIFMRNHAADEHDGSAPTDGMFLSQSRSLQAMPPRLMEFSEEEEQYDNEENMRVNEMLPIIVFDGDAGSARTRKTRLRTTTLAQRKMDDMKGKHQTTRAKSAAAAAIKGRRKLRESNEMPDIDVDVE